MASLSGSADSTIRYPSWVQERSFAEAPEASPILDPFFEREEQPRKGFRWGLAAAIAMAIVNVSLVGATVYGGVYYIGEARRAESAHRVADNTARDEVESKAGTQDDPRDTVHAPLVPPHAATDPGGSVPQDNESRDIGHVKVVEIGVKVPSLRVAIMQQVAAAKAQGKEVLLMTSRDKCEPCDSMVKTIAEPSMQKALEPVVVVRVDTEVFEKDLEAMQIQHQEIPGFFLLGADGAPRDSIHGGEWDADIAENIAPVLGPFVRGEYKKRRHEWKKPLPHGVFL